MISKFASCSSSPDDVERARGFFACNERRKRRAAASAKGETIEPIFKAIPVSSTSPVALLAAFVDVDVAKKRENKPSV